VQVWSEMTTQLTVLVLKLRLILAFLGVEGGPVCQKLQTSQKAAPLLTLLSPEPPASYPPLRSGQSWWTWTFGTHINYKGKVPKYGVTLL
jgi:hypothetical protein